MAETLLIVGASVRAAAQSAKRAGYAVCAVDLFGDADLQAIAPTVQVAIEDYPNGLIAAADRSPPGAWMYTGGLENYPSVVGEISKSRELLGCTPDALLRCRDPYEFRNQCFLWAFPFVNWCNPGTSPDTGSWIRKPRASAGGHGISVFHQPPYPPANEEYFFEELKPGLPQSAVYLANGESFRILGVTEQLIGAEWAGASEFQYCGSIGPIEVEPSPWEEYGQFGLAMRSEFGLRGLFGVDANLLSSGELMPIEINPRYTASIEVLERALPIQPIAWHVDACRHGRLPDYHWEPEDSCAAHGKVIVYAREAVTISQRFVDWCQSENEHSGDWPALADLPHVDTKIDKGQPVLTAFARGSCVESLRQELRRQAEKVYRLLK